MKGLKKIGAIKCIWMGKPPRISYEWTYEGIRLATHRTGGGEWATTEPCTGRKVDQSGAKTREFAIQRAIGALGSRGGCALNHVRRQIAETK